MVGVVIMKKLSLVEIEKMVKYIHSIDRNADADLMLKDYINGEIPYQSVEDAFLMVFSEWKEDTLVLGTPSELELWIYNRLEL